MLLKTRRMTSSDYWFDIEPVPASRPRFRTIPGKNFTMTYYAGKYKKFITDAEKAIPQAGHTHEGNLEVTVRCIVTKPKTTKRPNPNGDVDNYAKGVLDALTKKGYWGDDMQIVSLHVTKEWATDQVPPGIRLSIGEVV